MNRIPALVNTLSFAALAVGGAPAFALIDPIDPGTCELVADASREWQAATPLMVDGDRRCTGTFEPGADLDWFSIDLPWTATVFTANLELGVCQASVSVFFLDLVQSARLGEPNFVNQDAAGADACTRLDATYSSLTVPAGGRWLLLLTRSEAGVNEYSVAATVR